MKVNLGNYLEGIIKKSNYSKKDLWNLLCTNFEIGEKPTSYTTFSNNIKSGDITLNEAIALSTLINLDFNFLSTAIKEEAKKFSFEENKSDSSVLNIELALNILNEYVPATDITFTKEDLYAQDFGDLAYDALYCDNDLNRAYLCRLIIFNSSNTITPSITIEVLGDFNNFKNYLNKQDLEDFIDLDIAEKMNVVEHYYDNLLSILNRKRDFVEVGNLDLL